MPDWNSLVNEIEDTGSTHDLIRRKYLKQAPRAHGKKCYCLLFGVAPESESDQARDDGM